MKIVFFVMFLFVSILVSGKEVSIMSYNVENLFDTVHDEGKEDWEYLPKNTEGKNTFCSKEKSKRKKEECFDSDWTDKKLKIKLEQITKVVKAKDTNLPDLLAVVEVENKNVLTLLSKELGYNDFEITDGPDNRGVDVGLFYKENESFKKVSRAEHVVPTDYSTRNILEVRFKVLDKYFLTVFVNHWPSLHNPDSARVKAAEVLRKRTEEVLKINPDEAIISMGDFNTIDSNDPHPFKTVLYKDNFYTDVYDFVKSSSSLDEKFKANLASGTYYFPPKDDWNMLDHFFVNKNLIDGTKVNLIPNSFEIFSIPEMLHEVKKKINKDSEKGIKIVLAPKRYNHDTDNKDKAGFSDHFPIFVKLDFEEIKVVEKDKKVTKTKKSKKKK